MLIKLIKFLLQASKTDLQQQVRLVAASRTVETINYNQLNRIKTKHICAQSDDYFESWLQCLDAEQLMGCDSDEAEALL